MAEEKKKQENVKKYTVGEIPDTYKPTVALSKDGRSMTNEQVLAEILNKLDKIERNQRKLL